VKSHDPVRRLAEDSKIVPHNAEGRLGPLLLRTREGKRGARHPVRGRGFTRRGCKFGLRAARSRAEHGQNQRKIGRKHVKNGRFATEWTLSNPTDRFHSSPPNPTFSRHRPQFRRSPGWRTSNLPDCGALQTHRFARFSRRLHLPSTPHRQTAPRLSRIESERATPSKSIEYSHPVFAAKDGVVPMPSRSARHQNPLQIAPPRTRPIAPPDRRPFIPEAVGCT